MKILIEDADTLEYLASNGRWTKNAAEGKSFGATDAAFQVAKKEPIARYNIVSYISQTRQFVNLDHGRGKGHATSPAWKHPRRRAGITSADKDSRAPRNHSHPTPAPHMAPEHRPSET